MCVRNRRFQPPTHTECEFQRGPLGIQVGVVHANAVALECLKRLYGIVAAAVVPLVTCICKPQLHIGVVVAVAAAWHELGSPVIELQ